MNLLKTLFNSEMKEVDFFNTVHPLMNNFSNSAWSDWQSQSEAAAVVKSAIQPGQLGHVKFHGVRWRACCDRPLAIPPDTTVRVLGRRANILVVEPLEVCILN